MRYLLRNSINNQCQLYFLRNFRGEECRQNTATTSSAAAWLFATTAFWPLDGRGMILDFLRPRCDAKSLATPVVQRFPTSARIHYVFTRGRPDNIGGMINVFGSCPGPQMASPALWTCSPRRVDKTPCHCPPVVYTPVRTLSLFASQRQYILYYSSEQECRAPVGTKQNNVGWFAMYCTIFWLGWAGKKMKKSYPNKSKVTTIKQGQPNNRTHEKCMSCMCGILARNAFSYTPFFLCLVFQPIFRLGCSWPWDITTQFHV